MNMSKKEIKAWTTRINRDLGHLIGGTISAAQFRRADTGHADLDEIISVILQGDVRYVAA